MFSKIRERLIRHVRHADSPESSWVKWDRSPGTKQRKPTRLRTQSNRNPTHKANEIPRLLRTMHYVWWTKLFIVEWDMQFEILVCGQQLMVNRHLSQTSFQLKSCWTRTLYSSTKTISLIKSLVCSVCALRKKIIFSWRPCRFKSFIIMSYVGKANKA